MSFTNSYRLERIYFEKLKDMINKLQPYLNEETDEKLKAILENSIDDNGAILLLYRNLGEAWAELSDLIKKADEKIDQTKEEAERYHDELNQRIDEVNNYIMVIIRNLEETVADHERRIGDLEECCEDVQEALENKQDKLTPGIGIEIDENSVIDNTILKADAQTNLRNSLLPYMTINNVAGSSDPTHNYYMVAGQEVNISANGAQWKELLNGYNALLIQPGVYCGDNLNNVLAVGDVLEGYLSYNVISGFLFNLKYDIVCPTFVCHKRSADFMRSIATNNVIVFGIKNRLKNLEDTRTYAISISLLYYLKYNNNLILPGGTGSSLVIGDNFRYSNVNIFGYK